MVPAGSEPQPPLRRRVAFVVGALVLIGGAVVVLRAPQEPSSAPAPKPPVQTTVRDFAADGVVAPRPGEAPAPPDGVRVVPGPHRLVLGWGQRHTGRPEPEGATGYEVRWGPARTHPDDRLPRGRVVGEPAVQLGDLADDRPYDVEIRSIDSFGRRSAPLAARGTPRAADDSTFAFVDRFGTRVVPDPVSWRLAGPAGCGHASRPEGGTRLVIGAQCGREPLALRARAPLRLRPAPVDGEFGRFVVETDQPGQSGTELLLDLVPGPADLIAGSPNGSPDPAAPGLAQDDPSLPPGAVRVRVSGVERTSVQVLVAPGTRRTGQAVPVVAPPVPEIGVSARWEVALTTTGVRVLRDGQVVGGGDVVPDWREATALVGFLGARSGLYASVDMVGFVGAETAPPVLVPPPPVDAGTVVVATGAPSQTPTGGERVAGAASAQLRLTLLPQGESGVGFTVEVGGEVFPLRPAVPGQPMARGVRYPVVADLPVSVLVLRSGMLPVRVLGPVVAGQAATRVVTAAVELTAVPGAVSPASGTGIAEVVPLPRSVPAKPTLAFLDAAGGALPPDARIPRGRAVVEIRVHARLAQRGSGEAPGLAGVEMRVDGERVVGIPTSVDGPAAGGVWRVALDTAGLAVGRHSVEVTTVGPAGPASTSGSFELS